MYVSRIDPSLSFESAAELTEAQEKNPGNPALFDIEIKEKENADS